MSSSSGSSRSLYRRACHAAVSARLRGGACVRGHDGAPNARQWGEPLGPPHNRLPRSSYFIVMS